MCEKWRERKLEFAWDAGRVFLVGLCCSVLVFVWKLRSVLRALLKIFLMWCLFVGKER